MRRLTDYNIKKQKIETKTIDITNIRTKKIKKITLPLDISFTFDKYLPSISVREKLPRKHFYRVTSKDLMSVQKKYIETDLIHSSIDQFNICLDPFINLTHLKLDNCEWFDGRFLTRTIRNLVLHDIKHINMKNMVLDSLELGYMDGEIFENIRNCHANSLKLRNMKNLNIGSLKISYNSLEIRKCNIRTRDILKICQRRPLLDLIYEKGEAEISLKQNNYESKPSIYVRNCPKIPLKKKIESIMLIDIDHTKHLDVVDCKTVIKLNYVGNESDYTKLLRFAQYKKLIYLRISEAVNMPQTILYEIVSNCKNTLRFLDISSIEISTDFLNYLRKTLRSCQIYYSNGHKLLLRSNKTI